MVSGSTMISIGEYAVMVAGIPGGRQDGPGQVPGTPAARSLSAASKIV